MKALMAGWMLVIVALGIAGRACAEKTASVTLRGKVVELASVLKARGLNSDSEPVAHQVVLEARDERDGSDVPLLSDEASRAFFLDKRLRERSVEAQARRIAGLPYVQVVAFQVEDAGQMRTPEYYCEICSISVRYPPDLPLLSGGRWNCE